MTDLVERYSVESLLLPDAGARVMQPVLRKVDVHWHDYYELSLVLDGEADHVVNGRTHRLRPGSAFLLSPADFHAIDPGSGTLRCFNTVIDPGLVERQLDALGPVAGDAFPWLTDDFADAETDLRRLQREFEEPRLGSRGVTAGLVALLVVELARRSGVAEPPRDRPRGDDDLRAAVLYVDRHFREQLTLAEAAAQAHLSPNWFSERFRAHTGSSFQSYLQERRLRFARSLLASTSLTVTEVCHAAGFGDLSHFGRAYRRRYGTAPSARVPAPGAGPGRAAGRA
ncbi:AraC family transcriptional regulator [Nocardioides anomalus]|uniref:AraC family transcriptional regulator n=1 Tax=Nocardioides anomalus TaxID=2712223 RepID=A0A6G6WDM7_9ACTN|nr:AraC family transcriptional regulator [Nocardioides anomalus]QIG43334.1 AraC family transcriptional regulator [Nocardioides anomalus]